MNQLIGIGALIDRSWDHYRAHLPMLLKITAWMLIVAAINVVAILLYPLRTGEIGVLTGAEQFGEILLLLNNTVVAIVIGTWVVNALIEAIRTQMNGERATLPAITKTAKRLFWPQLWVRIMVSIVYVVALLAPFGVFWLATNVGSAALPSWLLFFLLFLSLLLFLIPIALAVILAFPSFAVVIDGKRGWAAIKESAARVRGRFWAVTARLLIPKLLYFGLFFVAQFLLVLLIRVIAFGLLSSEDSLMAVRVEWLALATSYAVLFIFLNPILFITDTLVYLGLKK